ncbi:MAG: hypothetical protein WCP98_22785 [Actinomycetes bacterium]
MVNDVTDIKTLVTPNSMTIVDEKPEMSIPHESPRTITYRVGGPVVDGDTAKIVVMPTY